MGKKIRSLKISNVEERWNSILRVAYATRIFLENTETHYSDYMRLINIYLSMLIPHPAHAH